MKSPPPAPVGQETPEASPSKVKDGVDSEKKVEEVKKIDEVKVEQSAITTASASDIKKPSDQYLNAQKKKNMKK